MAPEFGAQVWLDTLRALLIMIAAHCYPFSRYLPACHPASVASNGIDPLLDSMIGQGEHAV
jgi:hypothetical protein